MITDKTHKSTINLDTEKVFKELYKHYPKVRKWISSNGGSSQDAQDIFQEGLIILHRKISSPGFELTSRLETFHFGICKYLWNNTQRKKKPEVKSLEIDVPYEEIDEDLLDESFYKKAEIALLTLSEKCLDLLKLYYIKALKMVEIAKKLGYSSESSAKNQKYKCMEKARFNYKRFLNT